MGASPELLAKARAAEDAVFAAIEYAAERGLPCPSHKWLRDLLGSGSMAKVSEALKRLVRDGRIRIENPTQASRVVTIIATGRRTAGPKTARRPDERAVIKMRQQYYRTTDEAERANAVLNAVLAEGRNLRRAP